MAALGMCALMTACGGSSDSGSESTGTTEIAVKPQKTDIGGEWGKAYNVVEKEYKLRVEDSYGSGNADAVIKVSLTRNESVAGNLSEVLAGSEKETNAYVAGLEVEFFDESGESIFSTTADSSDIDKLLTLCPGDEATVTFKVIYQDLDLIKKAASFRIISTMEPNSKLKTVGGAIQDAADAIDAMDPDVTLDDAADALNAAANMMGAAVDAANALNKMTR